MRSKKALVPLFGVLLLPAFMYPALSLTPEQCRVATESCIGKCDPRQLDTHDDCVAACSSKLSGPCAANLRGSPASNKGPAGPTKGTHPIVGVSPPANAGANKGPSSGGTTVLEKSSGSKH
jgi:hypothetical protein